MLIAWEVILLEDQAFSAPQQFVLVVLPFGEAEPLFLEAGLLVGSR